MDFLGGHHGHTHGKHFARECSGLVMLWDKGGTYRRIFCTFSVVDTGESISGLWGCSCQRHHLTGNEAFGCGRFYIPVLQRERCSWIKGGICVEGKSQLLRILEVSYDQLLRLELVAVAGIASPDLLQSHFPGSGLALGCLGSSWIPFTAPRGFHCALKVFRMLVLCAGRGS